MAQSYLSAIRPCWIRLKRRMRTNVRFCLSTQTESLVRQRIGQGKFRERLLVFWRGRCAVTGLDIPTLLRASHLKSWADCENGNERVDVYNGLLLAPHLDALLDGGYLSVDVDGTILLSPALSRQARRTLGLGGDMRIRGLHDQHAPYLRWHRERVFRKRT